jgi:spore germination protein YaaH
VSPLPRGAARYRRVRVPSTDPPPPRPRRAVAVAACLAVVLLALLAASPAASQASPPGRHLRPDGRVALAWFYGGSTSDYMAQIDAAQGLSVASPTWWYLDEDRPGELELDTDDALTAHAHARGVAVWPLLGNHIDPDLTDRVLRDEALRRQVLDDVVAEVRRSGVDGVNVDFENLHDRTAPLLTTFVAELEAALPDHVVSVDVTAMTDTWVLGNWSTAFDREGLGRVADYVALMAYDEHNTLRRDGPVAGLSWVAESTEFLLRTVPADKVLLGIPLYSRDWADDPGADQGVALDATLGMRAMAERLLARSEAVTYDPVAGMDLHTYVDGSGRTHRVWHEDVVSLQRKVDLVATHGLAGIAAWRAGFEPPEVWTALDAQLAAMGPAPASAAPASPAPASAAPPPAPPTAPPALTSSATTSPEPPPAAPSASPAASVSQARTPSQAPSPTPAVTAAAAASTRLPRTPWLAAAAALLTLVVAGAARAGARRG